MWSLSAPWEHGLWEPVRVRFPTPPVPHERSAGRCRCGACGTPGIPDPTTHPLVQKQHPCRHMGSSVGVGMVSGRCLWASRGVLGVLGPAAATCSWGGIRGFLVGPIACTNRHYDGQPGWCGIKPSRPSVSLWMAAATWRCRRWQAGNVGARDSGVGVQFRPPKAMTAGSATGRQ